MWIKLPVEKLGDMYVLLTEYGDRIKDIRWTGHAVSVVLMKITYTALVKIFERKKPLGRASDGLEDNIKTYLQEAGYDGCNWIHESLNGIQWRDVSSTEMNMLVP